MAASAPSQQATVTRERIITEIKAEKFTVSLGCVVREKSSRERGIVFQLADPHQHATIAITVCWFTGETGYFNLEDFAEQCEITHKKI